MKKVGKNAKLYLIGMILGGITLGLTTVVADTIINSTNVSYKTSTVKAALDDLYGLTADDIWQKTWPIGSIYISVSPTSPATLFGGTWERFGNGKAVVGVDESDDDFKTVALTGGSKTKTIAVENLPAHSHSVNINTNEAGSHSHGVGALNTGGQSANHTHTLPAFNTDSKGGHSHNYGGSGLSLRGSPTLVGAGSTPMLLNGDWVGSTQSAGAHTHYVSAKNTGNQSANHTHSIAAHNTGTVANHTHNVNGNTGNTGSGTALNVQNPYITVYMWKRTA